jgi:hypothetical protein
MDGRMQICKETNAERGAVHDWMLNMAWINNIYINSTNDIMVIDNFFVNLSKKYCLIELAEIA